MDKEQIARALQLSQDMCNYVLNVTLQIGMLEEKKDEWTSEDEQLYKQYTEIFSDIESIEERMKTLIRLQR